MAGLSIKNFFRIDPQALVEDQVSGDESLVIGPKEFVARLSRGAGIVVATWNSKEALGYTNRFGVVMELVPGGVKVVWAEADAVYRPSPSGQRFWRNPFLGFAKDVAARYMLAAAFEEKFPDGVVLAGATRRPSSKEPRPSSSPTGGYVYLVKSEHGIKIGKSVNVKSRTKLFEVRLPFPITVEHYAWFDDYGLAERELHRKYHDKRLEGEWFNLSESDVAHIKTLGQLVPTDNL